MNQYMNSLIRSPIELSMEKNKVMISQGKNQTMSMRSLVRNPKSNSQKWDGLIQMNLPLTVMTLSIKKHADFSESTTKTFPEPSSSLELLDMHPKESPLPNGSEYSEEKSSTSTTSSHLCTILQLLKRERHMLAIQNQCWSH